MLTDLKPQFDGPTRSEAAGQARDFTPPLGNSQQPRVLVVDDESLVRWSLAETLAERGYDAAEAGDAASAISVLLSSRSRIVAVILDLYLPDAYDLRLLKALRQMSPETPVILMTAHGTREVTAEAIRLGAFAVLDKPFELADVGPVIEHALGSSGGETSIRSRPEARVRSAHV